MRDIFALALRLLAILIIGSLAVAILDEAVQFIRARRNTEGTVVYGFALYEKRLAPGWELLEFYQYRFECEFVRSRQQSNWETERDRILKTEPKETWQQIELPPVNRYECRPFRMHYRAGQGWGLF